MPNGKKLRKSKTDKKLLGVCGGLAEYFGIDPIWIRLAWAILIFVYGTGILLYFIFALIMSDQKRRAVELFLLLIFYIL